MLAAGLHVICNATKCIKLCIVVPQIHFDINILVKLFIQCSISSYISFGVVIAPNTSCRVCIEMHNMKINSYYVFNASAAERIWSRDPEFAIRHPDVNCVVISTSDTINIDTNHCKRSTTGKRPFSSTDIAGG